MISKGRFDNIPLINLSKWFSGEVSLRQQIAEEVRNACLSSGFMYIKNHGISRQVTDDVIQAAKDIFSLPLETKLKIHDEELGYYRGYIPVNGEKTDPSHSTDLKEAFDLGLQLNIDDPDHPGFRRLSAPNLWPENQPDFRISVERYFQSALDLAKELFRLFALSLDLRENYFDLMTDMPIAQMRLIRYPAVEPDSISDKLGIGTHTDYECFTLLLQDDIGGLELMNASGEWIDVPPITDSMMVNIGEMMSRWTNGRYAATPHRVRNHVVSDRISIPFFFATNYDTEIVCLETCYDDMNPAKFEPVMAGDYLQERLNSIYGAYPS
mgnify:FL=1|jgi:isopenicillin N synthase-like dioxygenase